jgi:Flp pilus assembly secretin CpaC
MLTTFRLQSGQTAYISGLTETDLAVTKNELPVLGRLFQSIPFLRRLVSNTATQSLKTQLLIVLTTTIVDPGDLRLPEFPVLTTPEPSSVMGTPPPAPDMTPLPSLTPFPNVSPDIREGPG